MTTRKSESFQLPALYPLKHCASAHLATFSHRSRGDPSQFVNPVVFSHKLTSKATTVLRRNALTRWATNIVEAIVQIRRNKHLALMGWNCFFEQNDYNLIKQLLYCINYKTVTIALILCIIICIVANSENPVLHKASRL